jgi:hypothetical protein
MPTELESLQAASASLAAKIAEVSAAPGPDYTINGQQVDKSKFLSDLISQRSAILSQINQESGPVWLETQVIPQ